VFGLNKIIFIRKRAVDPVKIVERSSGEVFRPKWELPKGVQQSIAVKISSFSTYD
jgi:hypothetical protein